MASIKATEDCAIWRIVRNWVNMEYLINCRFTILWDFLICLCGLWCRTETFCWKWKEYWTFADHRNRAKMDYRELQKYFSAVTFSKVKFVFHNLTFDRVDQIFSLHGWLKIKTSPWSIYYATVFLFLGSYLSLSPTKQICYEYTLAMYHSARIFTSVNRVWCDPKMLLRV